MKYVVDIPEDVYTRLFDNGIQDNEIAVDDVCEMARAIRKGKPLPKGHGRLIDESKIDWLESSGDRFTFEKRIKNTSETIIEADEEGAEK